MKKKLLIALAAAAALALPVSASAAGKAALPSFEVRLNGIEADNSSRRYPLAVYNDITYFPMTYYDAAFLGLKSSFTEADGLSVTSTNPSGVYRPENGPSGSLEISLPSYPITVNGVSIDNSAEEYPLLNIGGITYFPLTWRFVHDLFGWETSFNENGLTVTNHGLCGEDAGCEASLWNGWIIEHEGQSFRITTPEGKTAFIEAEGNGFSDGVGAGRYYLREMSLDDHYHSTLVAMHTVFPDGTVKSSADGALYIGDAEVRFEDLYGSGAMTVNGRTVPGLNFYPAFINGRLSVDVYDGRLLLAGDDNVSSDSVYAVDIETLECERLIPNIKHDNIGGEFVLSGGAVYAIRDEGENGSALMKYDLASGELSKIETVSDQSFKYESTFAVNPSGIYYKNGGYNHPIHAEVQRTDTDMALYRAGEDKPLFGGAEPTRLYSEGDYVIAFFDCTAGFPAEAIVIGPNGDVVFACCSPDLCQITVSDGAVYLTQYVANEDNLAVPTLFKADLE